jgi:hypothetical protein
LSRVLDIIHSDIKLRRVKKSTAISPQVPHPTPGTHIQNPFSKTSVRALHSRPTVNLKSTASFRYVAYVWPCIVLLILPHHFLPSNSLAARCPTKGAACCRHDPKSRLPSWTWLD